MSEDCTSYHSLAFIAQKISFSGKNYIATVSASECKAMIFEREKIEAADNEFDDELQVRIEVAILVNNR